MDAFSILNYTYDELEYLPALKAIVDAFEGEFKPEDISIKDLTDSTGNITRCLLGFTTADRRFELELDPYSADFNLFWLVNQALEYLDIPRRIADIPKGENPIENSSDVMLITPEAYNRALELGIFPWMDRDVFFSEKIDWWS